MRLGTFLDLHYLIGDQTMRLAVDGLRSFLVRSFCKAEGLSGICIYWH